MPPNPSSESTRNGVGRSGGVGAPSYRGPRRCWRLGANGTLESRDPPGYPRSDRPTPEQRAGLDATLRVLPPPEA